MKVGRFRLFILLLGGALALGIPSLPEPDATSRRSAARPFQGPPEARLASVGRLQSTYLDWKASHERNGGDRNLVIPLGWSRGLSSEHSAARGSARFDLIGGSARVEIGGLAAAEGWEVWLVDNQEGPGRSTLPERGDRMHRLGRLGEDGELSALTAAFNPRLFQGFEIDVVAVTREGVRPEEGTVLFGSPMLFQRLYTEERRQPRQIALAKTGRARSWPVTFGPRPAFADTPFNSLDPLVARGANLFFNETFGGNGRTCATCHPAENNFTIDPKFISTLPGNDPLFVAKANPALGERFEKIKLLREMGLVLENVDGFDDLDNKYVMRGVPHLLGLSRYLTPETSGVTPLQRTGWGGDGAPGGGTLRDFATGAVVQHFTKSLARSSGSDFRLPTDRELDAMEAFQLALGRQDNPDLSTVRLKNPLAARGLVQFNGLNSQCSVCHVNGGANAQADGTNRSFDIGVGRMPDHPADLIAPGTLRPDGGFGTEAVRDAENRLLGYGSAGEIRFNTQPAIEAVDTAPFFHNNAVQTVEEAVGYYNSKAFRESQHGAPLQVAMEPTEIENIAAFLRVMNALENIRGSLELDQGAIDEGDRATAKRLAQLAAFDTEDAWQVLEARQLHLRSIHKLKVAHAKEKAAAMTNGKSARDALLQEAIRLKRQARAEMIVVTDVSDVSDPAEDAR